MKIRWAIVLVLFTTLFTSSAQIFLKLGSRSSANGILGLVNWHVAAGLLIYSLGAIFAFKAFRLGQVSVIYPVFATSYIWVSISSYYFLGEKLNVFKMIGIAVIFIGISVVGLSCEPSGKNAPRKLRVRQNAN